MLMISHNRLMAGVRRWIGNPAPSLNDTMRKSMHSKKIDARSQPYSKTEIHTQPTGALASQLLNPKVPAEELLEYHRQVLWTYVGTSLTIVIGILIKISLYMMPCKVRQKSLTTCFI